MNLLFSEDKILASFFKEDKNWGLIEDDDEEEGEEVLSERIGISFKT